MSASPVGISWNVNGGLRGPPKNKSEQLVKSRPDALKELLEAERPDIVMLQETRLQTSGVDEAQGLSWLANGGAPFS